MDGDDYPSDPYDFDNSHDNDEEDDDDDKDDDDKDDEIDLEDTDSEVADAHDDDDDDDDDGGASVQRIGKDDYIYNDDDNNNDDCDDDDDYGDSQRHPKKRKLKTLLASYEFAPRVPTPSPAAAPKPSSGGRNPLTDWTEHETFVLLEAWGERFLKQQRKSLRSEEWQEIAEKVNQESKIERTDTQCRNRLDTLKKKYKKEKTNPGDCKWVYFKKMDSLLSASQTKEQGLSCGVDSGEYVFLNSNVHLNQTNGLNEMRDSPGKSEESVSEGLPPKKKPKNGQRVYKRSGASYKLLADSIHKFSEIYEKIEKSNRQQLLELEKMRVEFQKDLEIQKREILERAQAEIGKIRRGVDEDNDAAENLSD